MKLRLSVFLIILAIGLIGVAAPVSAQGTPSPLGIDPVPVPSALRVNVWMDRPVYAIGEAATVYFTVNRPSFIYLYSIRADGQVRLVFPNAFSRNNFVGAGTHRLPDGAYQFIVSPPAGVAHLQIFASMTPLNLAPRTFREPFPLVVPHSVRGRIMGITPRPTWATAWTSFTVAPGWRHVPPPPRCPPRWGHVPPPSWAPAPPCFPPPMPPFGWCVSGAWHWQAGRWHCGIPASGWHWFIGPDGRWHFRIHIRFGTD